MSLIGCSNPSSPTSQGTGSADAAAPVDGAVSPCSSANSSSPRTKVTSKDCPCSVNITPDLLEIYVSEPHITLKAEASPLGGTFVWKSADPSKLKISGSGNTATVKGLDEGEIQVTVDYTPPSCGGCSATATVKVKYEVRHILVARGIQFNNSQLPHFAKIPEGYIYDQLKSAAPFPLQLGSGGAPATFKCVDQGVKFTIMVTHSRIEFKQGLERDGRPGSKALEYWHVIYAGHSRYGRGACFGPSDAKGEDWENSLSPAHAPNGLYRMGYPFVGIPTSDILHHGYSTDVVSVKVDPPKEDREYKGKLYPKTLKEVKDETKAFIAHAITTGNVDPLEMSAEDAQGCLADLDKLDSHLRLVGDTVPLGSIGAPLKPDDEFWGYRTAEGPSVLLQAGWQRTVSKPMDLDATNLKCRVFCHFGCKSFLHYRRILRFRRNWKKQGSTDRLAYFTSDLSHGIEATVWIYHWMTYDKFNAGKPWEPSIEYARHKANAQINQMVKASNKANPDHPVKPYEIW